MRAIATVNDDSDQKPEPTGGTSWLQVPAHVGVRACAQLLAEQRLVQGDLGAEAQRKAHEY